MRTLLAPSAAALVLCCALATAARAEEPAPAAAPLEGDAQRLPYALGLVLGGKLGGLRLSANELEKVLRSLEEATTSARPLVDAAEWGPKVQAYVGRRQEAVKKAGQDGPAPTPGPERTLQAMGALMGADLHVLAFTAAEAALVGRGFSDAAAERPPLVDLGTWGPKVQEWAKARQERLSDADAAREKEASKAFLIKAAREKGAETFPSGLIYQRLRDGAGAMPPRGATVKVHYVGRLIDGTIFDSSRRRGEPATFPLTRVIRCWTEGVGKMRPGELAQLVCPSSIAYGDLGQPPSIPPGATLVFEVELLGIEGVKPGTVDPADAARAQREAAKGFLALAAAEPGAEKGPSGALYRQLTAGTGAAPTAQSTVTVHYQGRLIDGTVFEDTRKKGAPLTFPLSAVIKCWTEGMQKMKVGGGAQLVCPSDTAYGDAGQPPSVPGGAALVFEVELLAVENN